MAVLDDVQKMIAQTGRWPISRRREFLIGALKDAKGRHRRVLLSNTIRDLTTRVLRQEMRGKPR